MSWVVLLLLVQAGEPDEDVEEIVVTGTAGAGAVHVDLEGAELEPIAHLGEAITDIAGVSAVRKAASVTEPVLRGLGGERVVTRVGGVALYGACPSAMDPPITYLGSDVVRDARVSLGAGTVTDGPVGTGGSVSTSLEFRRREGAPELLTFARSFVNGARRGFHLSAGVEGGTDALDFRFTSGWLGLDDYRSADNARVPAGHNQAHASAAVGFRPDEDQRVWAAVLFQHDWDIDFPALPMDNRRTDFWLANAGYRSDLDLAPLERVEVRAGAALLDHRMNNRDKPNRGRLRAVTSSVSRSFHGSAVARLRPAPELAVDAGADASLAQRDATRTRALASGRVFEDRIWPDADQWHLGLFAELALRGSLVRWRLGARTDLVLTSAGAVTDSMRSQYESANPTQRAAVERAEPLVAVHSLVDWDAGDAVTVSAAAGITMRAAGITERTFAFGPAPGGFLVGNPALAAEKKWMLDLGVSVRRPWVTARANGFFTLVEDFILRTAIDRRDVNGDGTVDLVRGFRPVAAQLFGGELATTVRPWRWLSIPARVSYVRGINTTGDRSLPEIPPLEARAALRASWGEPVTFWAELGTRACAAQRRVDATFPEDTTPAFVTLHLRAGVKVGETAQLVAGVSNLLDAEYHEHLTREALLAAGDLAAGDEVPAPGRSLFVLLRGRL